MPQNHPMRVIQLPMWRDNYAWIIVDEASKQAALVDAPEAGDVLKTLEAEGLTLKAIWNTHHHPDHIGANKVLLEHFPDIEIAAHASDAKRIPGINHLLQPGDVLTLGDLSFETRHIPGHTLWHMAWIGHGAAFVGDTLFSLGCGRLFEGTPEQMFISLTQTLADLPDDTDIYCAHEYTMSNLKFALDLLPKDMDLKIAASEVETLREMDLPTVPSSMNFERYHNPFLRTHIKEVAAAVIKKDPACDGTPLGVFTSMRRLKDNF